MGDIITNESIWGTDFAARERKLAIARVPAMRRPKERDLAAGLPARGVFGCDVSAMDSRSVKRSLRGTGGFRVWWWRVASHVLGTAHNGSMEHVMYDYVPRRIDRSTVEPQLHSITIVRCVGDRFRSRLLCGQGDGGRRRGNHFALSSCQVLQFNK